jgi:transcriptional regulator with XRE-family HTH domain
LESWFKRAEVNSTKLARIAKAGRRLLSVAEEDESTFGQYVRRQRELQELTMRQLADLVGISNPYLSQIERGLREPSERVVDAIADNLEMSAEALKRHRVRVEEADEGEEPAVITAIRADKDLTAGQRRALIEVYEAFVAIRHPD